MGRLNLKILQKKNMNFHFRENAGDLVLEKI